jgi:hypothetical protein
VEQIRLDPPFEKEEAAFAEVGVACFARLCRPLFEKGEAAFVNGRRRPFPAFVVAPLKKGGLGGICF